MKNIVILLMSLIFVSGYASAQKSKSNTSTSKIKSDLKLPKFEKIKLDNGILIYFLSDQSLPQFTVQALLSKGSAHDQSKKTGQASIALAMLKEGSGELNSEQYKAKYSKYSSEFEFDVEKDASVFKSSGLSQYDKLIMDLFLDTLFKSHVMNDSKLKEIKSEFEKIKQKRLSQISKSVEQAAYYANISFQSILFKNQTYAFPEMGIKNDVAKLTIKDLQNYLTQNLKPENLQFALTGNYSEATKLKLIERLRSIKPSGDVNKDVADVKPSKEVAPLQIKKTKIVVIDKPNLKQAEVRIGHFGPKRSEENFVPLYIANSVVGSGDFGSLLMQEIRVKRGLVYGVNSYFAGLKDSGYFLLSASTRHDKVHELISTALGIVKDVQAKGISADGLELQRGILLGQFPMKFETDESFINQIMRYRNYGFQDDYILGFYEKIKNLKLEDANKILKQNYSPEQSLIVIFATKKDLPKDLEKLGYPIEYIDYRKVF